MAINIDEANLNFTRLYGFAYKVCKNAELSKELVHEAYIKLKGKKFNDQRHASYTMLKAIKCEYIDQIVASKRKKRDGSTVQHEVRKVYHAPCTALSSVEAKMYFEKLLANLKATKQFKHLKTASSLITADSLKDCAEQIGANYDVFRVDLHNLRKHLAGSKFDL